MRGGLTIVYTQYVNYALGGADIRVSDSYFDYRWVLEGAFVLHDTGDELPHPLDSIDMPSGFFKVDYDDLINPAEQV